MIVYLAPLALLAAGAPFAEPGDFPAAFRGHWEGTPTQICDPSEAEAIGLMFVETSSYLDTEHDANLVELSQVDATTLNLWVEDYDADTRMLKPEHRETWQLKDQGRRLHITVHDAEGRAVATRNRYRCVPPREQPPGAVD